MVSLTIHIPSELEIKFRRLTLEKYGDKKGRISKGAEAAIEEWCNKQME